jgi:mRNA interferase RelE/StbE
MSRQGTWEIEFLPSARKQLLALRDPVQDHVRAAITALADDPTPADSIAMEGKGTGLHRLRVGNYRVVYRIQRHRVCVLVIRIGHRSDVYRGWEPRP